MIALTTATANEDEQFLWMTIFLAQFGYSFIKLYASGTIVSLLPVLYRDFKWKKKLANNKILFIKLNKKNKNKKIKKSITIEGLFQKYL